MQKRVSFWLMVISLATVLPLLIAACESTPTKKKAAKKQKKQEESKETTLPFEGMIPPTSVGTEQVAVIETTKGKIVFELYPDVAPKTVANFIKLANQGFYNGTKFHRVEPSFVIQGGDPLSKDNDPYNDGTGGPGYTIPAEFNNKKHITGTVAMARTQDPNSAGSQFYITLAPQPFLDGKYTIFGQVIEGLDVIQKIEKGDVMDKVYIQNKE